jgi:opacity protein-like surface antigen
MKKSLLVAAFAVATSLAASAQQKTQLGVKAGYNWSYLTGSEDGFKPGNQTGFMASIFLSPTKNRTGLGYRTELVFSRQGYSFDNGGKNTDVLNDYIYMPQLTTFNIGKVVQLQAGAQIGYLLKSREKSQQRDTTITGLMNRFDYGFVGGVEVYPFKGIIVGGRYNLGLGKLHKHYESAATNPYPLPFNPETTDYKNSLFQFFVGYRF